MTITDIAKMRYSFFVESDEDVHHFVKEKCEHEDLVIVSNSAKSLLEIEENVRRDQLENIIGDGNAFLRLERNGSTFL
ncbi:MAG: hypothetical protein Kapaf2KO_00770 [Candidatus Kapaibacteriales bacterium]